MSKANSLLLRKINLELLKLPKVSNKILQDGRVKEYVIARVEEVLETIDQCGGRVVNPDEIAYQICIKIFCGREVYDAISKVPKVNGIALFAQAMTGYELLSFKVWCVFGVVSKNDKRSLVQIQDEPELILGFIHGIAYDRPVNLAEFETRWALEVQDGLPSAVAGAAAAVLAKS